jgi:hypothetical protein
MACPAGSSLIHPSLRQPFAFDCQINGLVTVANTEGQAVVNEPVGLVCCVIGIQGKLLGYAFRCDSTVLGVDVLYYANEPWVITSI